MDKHIAYCGLDCSKCSAYIATTLNNEELKIKTAEDWNKRYVRVIKTEILFPHLISTVKDVYQTGRYINIVPGVRYETAERKRDSKTAKSVIHIPVQCFKSCKKVFIKFKHGSKIVLALRDIENR